MATSSKIPLGHASNYHQRGIIDTKQEARSHAVRTEYLSSHRTRVRNFDATMTDITRPMPTSQRFFSKLIHLKGLEAASDILGSTLARPNALLSGAFFSFALTLGAYFLAKNLGYSLSGFESIGAFTFGWLLGLTYDFLKLMVTGRS